VKVLVTGASGRLGPYVVAELESAGHELVLMSRSRPEGAARWPWVQGDINRWDDCVRAFAAGPFDAVQHLAAQPWPTDRPNNRGQAEKEGLLPGHTMQTNVMGTYNLLRAAVDAGVGIFVMTGSNCALGHGYRISGRPFPFRYLPLDEEHPTDVEDSYSFSKLTCEKMLKMYTDAYGMRTYAVRAAGICGPDRRKQMADDAKPTEMWNDFLWAWVGSEDVASAHRLLMEKAQETEPHGCYFCNADDTAIVEPTREYLARWKPELVPLAGKLEGHASMFSNAKLRQTVGWRHKTGWR